MESGPTRRAAQTLWAAAALAGCGDASRPAPDRPDAAPGDAAAADVPSAPAAPDAADVPSAPVEPLWLPPVGTWAPILVEGTTCADGTTTGLLLGRGPVGATRILIYLVGGGACWDLASCYTTPKATRIARPMLPVDLVEAGYPGAWLFNRRDPENPFAGDHFAVVPYCTGDLHAGDRVAIYDGHVTRHRGARNFQRLAERLAATFPGVDRLVLAGSSAGGLGAILNRHRARAAFPGARIDVLDDSGPPLSPVGLPPARLAQWSEAWNLSGTAPPGCPECVSDMSAFVRYALGPDQAGRGDRVGLISSIGDATIAAYFQTDARGIEAGLRALGAAAPEGYAAFLIGGHGHVNLATPWVEDGLGLRAWIGRLVGTGADFATVGPDPLPDCPDMPDCATCAACAVERGDCRAPFAECGAVSGCVEAVRCGLDCPAAAADCARCASDCAVSRQVLRPETLALYQCVREEVCAGLCGTCR